MSDPTLAEIQKLIGAFEVRLEHADEEIKDQAAATNAALAEISARTDAATRKNAEAIAQNTRAVSSLVETLKKMQVPIWKRPTVLGGALAVFAVVAGYLYTGWRYDSPFPMYVHRNLLLTEKGIAQALDWARANADVDSPAYTAIGAVVADQVELEGGDTHKRIAGMARRHARRTYHEAKIYFPEELNSIGLGCLLAFDQGFVETVGADPARMLRLCERDVQEQVNVSIKYVDSTPLRIAFGAKKGETVTLAVDVTANSLADDKNTRDRPADAIEVFYDKGREPLEVTVNSRGDRISVTFPIEDDEGTHFFNIALTEAEGKVLVGLSDPLGDSAGLGELFVVGVSATVTVDPGT